MRTRYWSGKKIEDPRAHFWNNVDVQTNPDMCWEWKLSRNVKRGGYGNFFIHGRCIRAHRAAYEFAIGEIPEGLDVLHKCDNPPCCNPNHLSLGTQKDNARDMIAKGRCKTLPGVNNHQAKLTEDSIRIIRQKYGDGFGLTKLSGEFGVDPSTIFSIVNRQTWKHVGDQ